MVGIICALCELKFNDTKRYLFDRRKNISCRR